MARWPALLSDGVSSRAIRRAVREGVAHRVGHGGYALPDADPALIAAVTVNGVVSHLSAARLHGLELYKPPKAIDITVPRGRRAPLSGLRIHYADLSPEEHGTRVPVTSLLRTLVDCARTLSLVEAVVVLDSAVRNRHVTLDRLRAAARIATGPGSARIRQAIAHVDELSGSPLESGLRPMLDILGVAYETQVYIDGVGWVDFFVEGWLAIEGDGYEFHRDRAQYRDDRRRANRLVQGRCTLLRYTWEDVHLNRMQTLTQIAAVLENGPSTDASDCNSRC